MDVMHSSNLDLLRKITPNAALDQEIVSTIPTAGSGTNFTDRQAMLILRLSLKERNRRASEIWDNKGRAKLVRLSWYNKLTEKQLATVGLSLGKKEDTKNGSRRYRDAKAISSFISLDVGGNIVGKSFNLGADKKDDRRGEEEIIIPKAVKGATETLISVLASALESKTDRDGILKISVGWIHDMDGPTANRTAEDGRYYDNTLYHNDGDSEEETDHFTNILLNTKQVSIRSFLAQLDTAMVGAIPAAKWSNLTLHDVEFAGWKDGESFRTTLRERFGDIMTEAQIKEASADLNFMQIFVGYEYVSPENAYAVRAALGTRI